MRMFSTQSITKLMPPSTSLSAVLVGSRMEEPRLASSCRALISRASPRKMNLRGFCRIKSGPGFSGIFMASRDAY